MITIPEHMFELTQAERGILLRVVPEDRVFAAHHAFAEWAHSGQLAPEGDWRTWVLMAGRGFGKTRAGAEWVLDCVRTLSPREGGDLPRAGAPSVEAPAFAGTRGERSGATSQRFSDPSVPLHHASHGPPPRSGEDLRIALVAATVDEARRVMVEGPSGILACARENEIVDWSRSRGELLFKDGAIATLFSGANPEALRGPQHHFAWCDELAKWRHPQDSWDMLQLGLRCGEHPRALVTTTPRGGCAALTRILAAEDAAETNGATSVNPHLPPAFLAAMERAYGGTRLARQEIEGVLLSDTAGTLWPVKLIEESRGPMPAREALVRVVIGVDPPASAEGTCGIVACGLDAKGVGHVLADHSASGLSPEGWARKVAAAAEAHGADRVIAEKNQGGNMVKSMLRSAGVALPVTMVAAVQGKGARAEPVAGRFEAGKAKLAGRFAELEEELGGMVPAGYEGPGRSPDRADAMVWALWALLIAPNAEPRVRAA